MKTVRLDPQDEQSPGLSAAGSVKSGPGNPRITYEYQQRQRL
ncbi:hypothetical protein [Qipengyuania spongiae]|nr:hypothetical protein [Qipengyuania spongiae]